MQFVGAFSRQPRFQKNLMGQRCTEIVRLQATAGSQMRLQTLYDRESAPHDSRTINSP